MYRPDQDEIGPGKGLGEGRQKQGILYVFRKVNAKLPDFRVIPVIQPRGSIFEIMPVSLMGLFDRHQGVDMDEGFVKNMVKYRVSPPDMHTEKRSVRRFPETFDITSGVRVLLKPEEMLLYNTP